MIIKTFGSSFNQFQSFRSFYHELLLRHLALLQTVLRQLHPGAVHVLQHPPPE